MEQTLFCEWNRTLVTLVGEYKMWVNVFSSRLCLQSSSSPSSACHKDFTTSIDCHHNLVVRGVLATPRRIQAKIFASTSSDLLLMISN
ncbi:hypothetical protein MHU86_11711 [Fragilaria crotonensis]|nr:hypothetical protein MHU86_11711 [Fragilaria crotonensis]